MGIVHPSVKALDFSIISTINFLDFDYKSRPFINSIALTSKKKTQIYLNSMRSFKKKIQKKKEKMVNNK